MRRRLVVALVGLVAGCAPREPARAPTQPVVVAAPEPEVTPAGSPPLPVLPEVTAPRRPLENFGVLARGAADETTWWSIAGDMEPVPAAVAAALGLTRRVRMAKVPRSLRGSVPEWWSEDAVVMTRETQDEVEVVLVEPDNLSKRRWRIALDDRWHVLHFTPQTLVVRYTSGFGSRFVGYSLASGRELLRVESGGSGWSLDDERLFVWDGETLQAVDVATGARSWSIPAASIHTAWAEGERLLVRSLEGLQAFDAATGSRLWRAAAVEPGCALARGPVIVVEEPDGYRVLDPATGATLRELPAAGLCERTRWGYHNSLGDSDGRRFAAIEPGMPGWRGRGSPELLRVYDLDSAATLWSRPLRGSGLLHVDRDAVYIFDDGSLFALDAATGAVRAEISLGLDPRARGGSMSLRIHEHDEAGPVLIVDSSDSGWWAFGRRPEPTPRETYVIRGRLVGARAAGAPVKVGGAVVHADTNGRFEARGEALGVVPVSLALPREVAEDGSLLTFETVGVELRGAGEYDVGALALKDLFTHCRGRAGRRSSQCIGIRAEP